LCLLFFLFLLLCPVRVESFVHAFPAMSLFLQPPEFFHFIFVTKSQNAYDLNKLLISFVPVSYYAGTISFCFPSSSVSFFSALNFIRSGFFCDFFLFTKVARYSFSPYTPQRFVRPFLSFEVHQLVLFLSAFNRFSSFPKDSLPPLGPGSRVFRCLWMTYCL